MCNVHVSASPSVVITPPGCFWSRDILLKAGVIWAEHPAQAHRTFDRTDFSLLNDVKCLLEALKCAGTFQVLVWETGRRLHRLHLSRPHDPGAGGESSSAASVLGRRCFTSRCPPLYDFSSG